MEKSKFKIGDKVKLNVDKLDITTAIAMVMTTDLEEFEDLLVVDIFMCEYCDDQHLAVVDKKGNIEHRIPVDMFLKEENTNGSIIN